MGLALHHWVKLAVASLLILLLSGCSGPKLTPLAPNSVILAFGDSLTFGKGAADGQDYPSQLALLTGRKVINAGISGETTAEGLARFESVLNQSAPELIILLEGGNDILRNHDLAATENNLQSMITIAQNRAIDVVLVAVPSKQLFLSPASFYRQLADINNLVLLEDTLSDLLKNPAMKSDTVHLNAAGYRVLAEQVYQQLQLAGAL
ncbi:arylesterase [Shewanella sp. Scap07]|uniref:GDSL-type esterase/lipase family protein n=1 Tax=Shewanella sp. Scap07 TaxID=2589987 RepID=UPI0015C0EBF3|nr:GDSL-type esterase/lipase family protein [Shewanella sp. Scap07]QLE86548.1 arylesterase [Shewanella sp. Scap07]